MRSKLELVENIGRCALMSLLYEVSASPKPGLVDRFNQGAHKDMDFFTFMASSAALPYYFKECAVAGAEFQGDDLWKLFDSLRPIGMEAEKAMFGATGGVNTHKGLIFSLGVVSAAAAFCMKEKNTEDVEVEEICHKVSLMTEGLCTRELESVNKTESLTYGEKLYKKYGFKGVRGEAESGFPTVRNCSLPVLRYLKSLKKYHINDIFVQTLLHLMAVNEDTNVAARHDRETLEHVKQYARLALDAGGVFTPEGVHMIGEMDRDFIEWNISPGGSADLLAVTIMFDLLTEKVENSK